MLCGGGAVCAWVVGCEGWCSMMHCCVGEWQCIVLKYCVQGGAIYINAANAYIAGCTFSKNDAVSLWSFTCLKRVTCMLHEGYECVSDV